MERVIPNRHFKNFSKNKKGASEVNRNLFFTTTRYPVYNTKRPPVKAVFSVKIDI